ncbi:MAG: endo alpha-1,4 polygalactosaminidase [Ignavibacteriae bacterium]|nr:endo alpha-1,4 polygalactosaminidase [Ignavibacteriota bacterium]
MKLKLYIIIFFINVNVLLSQINLMDVKPWAYQLQNADIAAIANENNIKLIVFDYSLDGTDETKFTKQQINEIKNSGMYAISYISIGEAEDYRYYWKQEWKLNPPRWLGPENPNWLGNYKVKFWLKEWQDIVFDYIDTIISQGFDGIYLDIIDGWYYWAEENQQKPDADSLMCRFVINIRNHVNTIKGNLDFIIIPQNGENIIFSTNVTEQLRSQYLNSINAIGIEDVFFYGDKDEDNDFNPDLSRLETIQNYLSAGKQIYSIEYLTEEGKIIQYQNESGKKSFVPYSCTRALDKLCPTMITSIYQDNETNDFIINPISEFPIINYQLSISSNVRIEIYNLLGDKISTIVDELQEAGKHQTEFKADVLPQGMYYCVMKANGSYCMQKFIILD